VWTFIPALYMHSEKKREPSTMRWCLASDRHRPPQRERDRSTSRLTESSAAGHHSGLIIGALCAALRLPGRGKDELVKRRKQLHTRETGGPPARGSRTQPPRRWRVPSPSISAVSQTQSRSPAPRARLRLPSSPPARCRGQVSPPARRALSLSAPPVARLTP
jgi:hypothetical protein